MHPIEIKKHADPQASAVKQFKVLDKLETVKRGQGGVICLYDRLATLTGGDKVIPLNLL